MASTTLVKPAMLAPRHVVALQVVALAASQAALWMLFMIIFSRVSTSSRVQDSRMLFCDISRPETDTPPALAALPGP